MVDDAKISAKIHAVAVADLRARQADALAELRKREIADTAARLFAERGYHQTAVTDIARTMEIGHGTVYRYFENKREILDEVFDDLVSRLLATALSDKAPDAATTLEQYRAQVRHFATAFWELFDSDPAVRMLLRQAESVDPEMSARVTGFIEAASRLVAGYLENGQSRGFVADDVDVLATGQAVVALIVGSMLCLRTDDADVRSRYTEAAIALMFNGVGRI